MLRPVYIKSLDDNSSVETPKVYLSLPLRLWHLPCHDTPLGCNLVLLGQEKPSRYLAWAAIL